MSLPLYVALFTACLLICMLCAKAGKGPTRSCPDCGRETPIDGRRCRRCGYLLGRI
jgi:predicted amidophosphoribosyltransferase